MSFHLWIAFVAASVVLLAVPGPTILTVVSLALTHGRRASLPVIAGVALGDTTCVTLSLVGLGALLAVSAFWFTVVKWAGGLYLLYLGVRLMRTGAASGEPASPAPARSRWRLLARAYVVTTLNPKSIVFFVAFLPQFVDPRGDVTEQLWVLAVTFVVLATVGTTLYATFAASARRLLASPRVERRMHLASGSLLSAAGLWVLLARRPA